MLKIRLQGTKKEINWFKKVLTKNAELKVLGFSDTFPNKGTNKYFRVYGEVEQNNRR